MKIKILLLYALIVLLGLANINAQTNSSDANIFGHVVSGDQHLPFVNIFIENTTIGTSTDNTGHYKLLHLPEGVYALKAQALGYKPHTIEVNIVEGKTQEINFTLIADVLGLEEVTITGNRNETNRRESPVIVSTISPNIFNETQSSTISEGLNYTPGIRTEVNCQNCGFNQVRMNGMEGPYSQILINSRPIFSGLAGVYGLELLPASMIERVEVVRGGGSALYGSNAIAGTINLILKDPINNSFEFGGNTSLIGIGIPNITPSLDYQTNMNASIVSPNAKSGLAVYGFYRNRKPFDANNDSFSEISKINNVTVGTRFFHRTSKRSKLAIDFFAINEDRRGGNKFDYPEHEADIAESLHHQITSGAITFDHFLRKKDKISAYFSAQGVKRNSYYGANNSLKDYGKTSDLTYAAGIQYIADFNIMNVTMGIENNGTWLNDSKLGYPNLDTEEITHTDNVLIAHQMTNITGIYAQYELGLDKFKLSAGARFDNYQIIDLSNLSETNSRIKTGNVLSPRLSILYDLWDNIQARVSYSQGYRAPQIYDEDLHIETSGSRQIIHRNSPDLKQETSQSISASVDINIPILKTGGFGILVEGFHTLLSDPFTNEFGAPDNDGLVIYTRTNALGTAMVQGVNIELKMIPNSKINITGGFTLQHSKFSEPQEFNEKRFLRTPSDYGFLTFDYKAFKHFGASVNCTYTGKMLVPYFGLDLADPELGMLRTSNRFYDMGIKLRYTFKFDGFCLQVFSGIKNILNSYQNDFDSGILRDPAYIYGPAQPRTIYLGIKLGNGLQF